MRKFEAKLLLSPIWTEFKVFLQQIVGETWVFVNNLWDKFHIARQYKLKDVIDWWMHLEYLQFVLKKFEAGTASSNNLFIWYFWDDPRFFIRTQLDKKNCNLDNWQEVMKWAIDAKVKSSCQALFPVQETDTHYPHNHRLT